jgi:hypothetical protein
MGAETWQRLTFHNIEPAAGFSRSDKVTQLKPRKERSCITLKIIIFSEDMAGSIAWTHGQPVSQENAGCIHNNNGSGPMGSRGESPTRESALCHNIIIESFIFQGSKRMPGAKNGIVFWK